MKKCSKCGIFKDLNEFHKDKYKSSGLTPQCGLCRTEKTKESKSALKAKNIKTSIKAPIGNKICSSCHKYKSVCEFAINRYSSDNLNHSCKECIRLYLKSRYINPLIKEKLNKNHAKWYSSRGKLVRKDYDSVYKEVNKERIYIKRKEYRSSPQGIETLKSYNNSAIGKLSTAKKNHKRRTKIKESERTLTLIEWETILITQKNKCYVCSVEFNIDTPATMDHLIPVIKGGGLTKENIKAACRSCNSRKGAK